MHFSLLIFFNGHSKCLIASVLQTSLRRTISVPVIMVNAVRSMTIATQESFALLHLLNGWLCCVLCLPAGLPWQKFEYLLSKYIHIGAGEMAQWVKHKDQSWDPQHPHEEAGRCGKPACNTALEK